MDNILKISSGMNIDPNQVSVHKIFNTVTPGAVNCFYFILVTYRDVTFWLLKLF